MKSSEDHLIPQQQAMVEVWERHMRAEFVERSADAALATMSAMPYLNHVPVMTGGVGREEIRAFYAERFIPQMPPDAEIELISRTVGQTRIVDEFIFKCITPARPKLSLFPSERAGPSPNDLIWDTQSKWQARCSGHACLCSASTPQTWSPNRPRERSI
jgi:hypothetical protein